MMRFAGVAILSAFLSSSVLATGGSAVQAVRLLSLGDRASIAIELAGDGAEAKTVGPSAPGRFVVDIGPMAAAVASEILRADPSAPLVREVRVEGLREASDRWIARVHVELDPAAKGSIRTAKRRVYLDFAPRVPASVVATRTPTGAAGPLTATGTAGVSPSSANPAALSAEPPAPRPAAARALDDASLDELLAQAGTLAREPDVKGLLAVRARILRRLEAASPGTAEAARADEVGRRLDAYIAEAQQLQLAKDAQLFRQAQLRDYQAVMRLVLSDLDDIDAALRAANPTADARTSARAASRQLSARLNAVKPPADAASSHTSLSAAAGELAELLVQAAAETSPALLKEIRTAVNNTRSIASATPGDAAAR
jgi:hypothetical protein